MNPPLRSPASAPQLLTIILPTTHSYLKTITSGLRNTLQTIQLLKVLSFHPFLDNIKLIFRNLGRNTSGAIGIRDNIWSNTISTWGIALPGESSEPPGRIDY